MNHTFNVSIAKRYGVNEAIMISNFQYWIAKNKANNKHQYDERTWTYNSVKAFEELFPYFKPSQIRRCLESLVEQGVLIKGEYSKNPYDRTSWFAFYDESTFLFQQLDLSNLTTRNSEFDNSYTDSKPNSKQDKKLYNGQDEFESKKKGFTAPTIQEISEYLKTKHPIATQDRIDAFATKFWSHYENKNWSYGRGQKMKDWRLAFGQWQETITKDLYQSGTAPTKPSPPRKSKVKYFDTDFPSRVNVATREEFDLIVSGNPDSTYEIVYEYLD